jgi:DNA-binding NarL/FixJ family response regulator
VVITLLVVDDEPLVRDAVREILETDGEIETRVAGDGREAVDMVDRYRPDVVLMDIRMPVLDGLAATQEIRRRHPEQRIVVLTTFGDAEHVDRAVALGVDGFLLKSGDPIELLRGVRAVADGGASLSSAVAAMVLQRARGAVPPPGSVAAASRALAGLPPRERDVVDLVAEGLTNAEIAARLRLTETTVKGYLSASFARLGVSNRVQAALVVWRAR